ncbi:hypothetical protein SETIT_5G454500v2 [Setaria italica]|uniref:F-box domain-containing protein n=2 Tax=Setaria italica TaxID=4555 RepID=A0A368RFU6_SETIT|nr:F-box protein At5g07610 [Setaria italica]RCV29077.1 hypothetical protein SETIT_5G454500v2 [Setaria italica]
MDDDGKLSAANLPDDVFVDILSRLPVRQLCSCKCVSRAWRDLISHPDHRRRLAQTVSGFFYHLHVDASCPPIPYWRFSSAASPPGGAHVVDPAFPFLPSSFSRTETELLDSCNGLLLLRCCRASPSPSSSLYVVCNPATGKWVELPAPTHAPGTFGLRSDYLHGRRRTRLAALAFDPAVSSTRFHVFQLVERDHYQPFLSQYRFVVEAVEIYSSETSRWVPSSSTEWSCQVTCTGQQATYHNGSLHFAVDDGGVLSVDTNASWRITYVFPHSQETFGGGFVGRSQGRLLYVHKGSRYAALSVYSLERRRWSAEQWTLKHYASPLDQFRKTLFKEHDGVVAVHPDGDVIFLFDASRGMLMAYDMVRRTVRDIQPLAQASPYYPFFPYVPLHSSEALAG